MPKRENLFSISNPAGAGCNADKARNSFTPTLWSASILRTGVQIDFVPKGLQDSARGFNPGYG